MRYFFAVVGILALMMLPASVQTQDEVVQCEVSETFAETIDENNFMLLRVTGMVNSGVSSLDNSRIAASYYTTLASMRRYHEDLHESLPECGQSINRLLVESTASAQDVIGLMMAQDANPESAPAYASAMRPALERLNEKFVLLARAIQSTEFVSPDV